MTEWFLVLVLAGNASGLVPIQRFETEARCEQQLAVEAVHAAVNGRTVVSAHCQRVRIPSLRPVTGEVVTR